MFDFGLVTNWFNDLLLSVMPQWAATVIECVIIGVVLLLAYALLALFYIFYERKLCAWFQCRLGPMRVGPWGILQSFADMFKILIKELIRLENIDRFLFALAPYLVIVASMLCFACLPWGNGLQIIDFNIGIFFMTAASSIGVLGILLAGWSSNNKYTMIGALRSGAQMISYELSIGLSILFYLAEYLNLFIVSGIASLLFLGGWMPLHIPGWEGFNAVMDFIPSIVWFIGKAVFISFIIIWFKWSFPRVRIDQLLTLEWKYLMPIGLFNLVLMTLIVVYGLHF